MRKLFNKFYQDLEKCKEGQIDEAELAKHLIKFADERCKKCDLKLTKNK